jgi:hypothetical protein
MTSQGNGRPVVYQISISGQTGAHLKDLHAQAASGGTGPQFLNALRQIHERLKTAPQEFGEPQYRLPALGLTMFKAVVIPLVVFYGVHDEKPLVFITHFTTLS